VTKQDSLSVRLSSALTQYAERRCLTWPGSAPWSYADLDDAAGRLSRALHGHGVGKGDRVLVQVDKSPHALALYLAVLRTGAIYVPLNTDYTPAEIAYFLADAEPRLAVCRPGTEGAFGASDSKVVSLGADDTGSLVASRSALQAAADCGDGDPAAILYTSGTTGRPKGALLSHGNLLTNAEALIAAWRFTAADLLIHALPIFHTHGLFVACHCALLSGASMAFLPRFDADAILALMPRASVLMGVPTFYTRLLAHEGLTREAAAKVRLFISGSAPLSAETFRAFEARTGKPILERYGMTETGMLTSNPYDGSRRAGSVGLPLAGVRLRVTDPTTAKPLPDGQVGMVEVAGPNVFKGYWRAPEKTAASFREDGYFITGDFGFIDETGYLRLVGRASDVIISGGLNIYPKEVENALEALPGVAEAAVVGVAHPDFGEAVVAVIKPAHALGMTEERLRTALRGSLAAFKIPKRVLFIDELPRNAMGKVQKTRLRERYRDLFAENAS
jgi:malonyl-CoA/methylmalonyl-CoA synthetase